MEFVERPKESFFKVRRLDRYMEGHAGFIAGGCFKDIFSDQKFKDIDIFFLNESDFLQADQHFKQDGFDFVYENSRVRCYRDCSTGVRIELIRQTYGTPEQILSMFDFSIVKYAYARRVESDGITYYNLFVSTFFEDLVNNKLIIDGQLLYPVSTFERTYRYQKYGYTLCKESKGRMIDALQGSSTADLGNDLYFGID